MTKTRRRQNLQSENRGRGDQSDDVCALVSFQCLYNSLLKYPLLQPVDFLDIWLKREKTTREMMHGWHCDGLSAFSFCS